MLSDDERRRRNAVRSAVRYAARTEADRLAENEAVRARYHADLPAARARGRDAQAKFSAARSEDQKRKARSRDSERYLRIRDTPEFQERRSRQEHTRSPVSATDLAYRARVSESRNQQLRAQQRATETPASAPYRYWTRAEDKDVVRTDRTVMEIAFHLNRTRAAVVSRRRNLKRIAAVS